MEDINTYLKLDYDPLTKYSEVNYYILSTKLNSIKIPGTVLTHTDYSIEASNGKE